MPLQEASLNKFQGQSRPSSSASSSQTSPTSPQRELHPSNPFRQTASSAQFNQNDTNNFTYQSSRSPQQQQTRQGLASDVGVIPAPINNSFDSNTTHGDVTTPNNAYFPPGAPVRSPSNRWNNPSSPSSQHFHSPQQVLHSPSFSAQQGSHGQPTIFLHPSSPPSSDPSALNSFTPTETSSPFTPEQSNKHIGFLNPEGSEVDPSKFGIITEEQEEVFDNDETVKRKATVMKRHRWGTQRHVKGRPKNTPKRNKSIFSRSHSSRRPDSANHSDSLHQQQNDSSETLDIDTLQGPHKVFFNMPLPQDMLDPETGAPIRQYPRNKIRTAKYTPLSFIPKNLFFQFQNVANIYFLFIVILGVSMNI